MESVFRSFVTSTPRSILFSATFSSIPLQNWCLLVKERIFPRGAYFLFPGSKHREASKNENAKVDVPEIVPIHLKCNNCMSAFDVILLAVGVPEIVPTHLKL